jgi:hypothetical protein
LFLLPTKKPLGHLVLRLDVLVEMVPIVLLVVTGKTTAAGTRVVTRKALLAVSVLVTLV